MASGYKSIPTAEKVQVPTQCLDRTRARKGGGGSRQTFRHSTGNGWALGNMNPIRCSKKQEELLKSSALSQPSVTKTERSLPSTFSSLWSHTEPTTSASSGKQIRFFKQSPWNRLSWGRARLTLRLSSAHSLRGISPCRSAERAAWSSLLCDPTKARD